MLDRYRKLYYAYYEICLRSRYDLTSRLGFVVSCMLGLSVIIDNSYAMQNLIYCLNVQVFELPLEERIIVAVTADTNVN